MDSVSHPKRVEGLVWTIAGSTNPGRALWYAVYYTAWVAKAVFTMSGVEEARRKEVKRIVRENWNYGRIRRGC
jgi:hypothetical protein